MSFLKNHFLSGLLVLTPFVVIIWVAGLLLGFLWGLTSFIPHEFLRALLGDSGLLTFVVRVALMIVVTASLAFGVSSLGWVSKFYFGKRILEWLGEAIGHIPVLRSIYGALDQLLKTVSSSGNAKQFSRVVFVEYPRKGIWSLAFVTSAVKSKQFTERHLNIFIPTTPNPTSGFHLMVEESDVRESHLSVEEAFRMLLSLGIAQKEN